jgi:serine/threonine-protein kinase HipA
VVKSGEEIALPIRGKKSNLNRADLFDYFGRERLGLSEKLIKEEILKFNETFPAWDVLLKKSFLSQKNQDNYFDLLQERRKRLR